MAQIEEALKTLITTSAAFVNAAALSVYPGHIPQDARLPAVAYQMISTQPDHAHDGPTGFMKRNFQFTIDAASYAEVKATAQALRRRLDGYQGTVDGIRIGGILWQNEYDGYNELSTLETVRQDYLIIYQE